MNEITEQGTDEQQQALRDLVKFALGGAIVAICNPKQIDGGWLENCGLGQRYLSSSRPIKQKVAVFSPSLSLHFGTI